MAEKTSQANSSSNNLPNIPAVAPTSDTSYIQPVIGKLGFDTEHPDIFGIGSSPDNGVSFHVWASFKGIIFDKDNIDTIWNNGTSDRVKKEVDAATAEIPAVKSAADEAVKKADSAIASSKVNSDAIVAQSNAISEAKSLMESSVAEINQAIADANSNAAKIRADVDQVQSEVNNAKAANSASVEALKSDIDTAKQDLANVHGSLTKAQSAVEQNQKLINDSVAKISNDIAQDRKDLATAQQNNADLAKQLDDYSKQAEAQGKTIKSIQNDQNGFTATLADVKGNVTQVSDKVDGLSASLKDAQDNVATVKAQADQLNATLTDHAKSIATLTASAKELSSTLEDADGRLSKVEQTAQTNSSTLSDVQGDLSQVKQTADGLVTTLKDAKGNIDQIKQTAKGTAEQLSNAQGDITALQKDVSGIKLTIADHDKNIHTLQADSKALKDDMADAKGNISSLQKTSTSLVSEFKDHDGRISKVEQTASELNNEFSDQQGHLNRVEQTANGTQQTVANQQGQINSIQTDVSGVHQTITGQGNQIANINVTLNGLSTKYEGVSGDLGKLKSSTMQDRGTVTSPDFNSLTQAGYYTVTMPINGKNYPTGSWGTLEISGQTSDSNGRLNQKYVSDNNAETYVRQYNAYTKSWTAWIKTANQNDVTALSNRITTNSTQITQNKQAIALKADQSTVNNLSGEVSQNSAQLKVQADQISSKVSSTDFKTLNDKVNGMQIGGRNLLLRTSTTEKSGRSYDFAQYSIAGGLKPNTTYTFSGWARVDQKAMDNKQNVFVCAYTNDWSWSGWLNIAGSLTAKYNKITFTTPTGKSFSPVVTVYLSHHNNDNSKDSLSGIGFISRLKLEEGNVATDWTPAPEDATAAIQSNTTAINQNKSAIALKASQADVDTLNNTVKSQSASLSVLNNQISSKVTATDVNNIVNGKGYTTTSTVQSLIDQKAGTINESITKLSNEFDTRNGINLLTGTADFSGNWFNKDTSWFTSEDWLPPEAKNKVYRDANHAWDGLGQAVNLDVGTYTFSMWIYTEFTGSQSMTIYAGDNQYGGTAQLNVTQGFSYSANQQQNAWIKARFYFTVTKAGIVVVRPELNQSSGIFHVASYKLEKGTNPNPVWSPAPGDNATTTQIQSLTASIDGIQSAVRNKADSSTVTQLSNLVQSKVSSNDFNSKYTQLSNMIDARVSKGDLLGEINLQAGSTLIKNNKIYLDGESVVFGEKTKAFIPSAAIENLEADKITTGTLNGIEIRQLETGGRSIDIKNGNIAITSHDPYEPRISFTNDGKNMKMFNALGDLEVINQEFALFNFTPEDTHSLNPIPFFKVTNTGQIGSGGAQLNMDHAIFDGYEWWTSAAGVTFGRTWNGIDKSSDYADIYAKSFVPHSELSAKTRIKKLDRKEALKKIMQDDMYTYQFKEDVRDGVPKRYASFIIDNIHDVAQYTEPEEFLSANGKGRDDGTQLAYLIAAVQYQQEQIEELKKKLEEK